MNDHRPSQPGNESGHRLPRGGEAVQTLRQALERVERESASLVRVAGNLEDFVRQQEARYGELEQELNDTALLYVASEQFQAAIDPKQVVRHVHELLEQLIGAELFAVYLCTDGCRSFVPIASRGLPAAELARASHEGALERVMQTGRALVVQGRPLPTHGTLTEPIAAVPLLLADRPIGGVLIAKLFAHKDGWAMVDPQLLQLVATRAAPALLAAHLLRNQTDLLGTLADLGDRLK